MSEASPYNMSPLTAWFTVQKISLSKTANHYIKGHRNFFYTLKTLTRAENLHVHMCRGYTKSYNVSVWFTPRQKNIYYSFIWCVKTKAVFPQFIKCLIENKQEQYALKVNASKITLLLNILRIQRVQI